MKKLIVAFALSFIYCHSVLSQETFPTNGPADERERYHAFTNATIVVSPGNILQNATLVIRNKKVVSVSADNPPKGAVVHNMNGKTIYPSFIELRSNYGVEDVTPVQSKPSDRGPQPLSYKKGAYGWNQAIHPELDASEHFQTNEKKAEELRQLGFGTALSHIQDGIARGTATLVTLGNERENEVLLEEAASHHFSFDKGSSTQDYPTSLMGSIALLRQSHYDADWYQNNEAETNLTLEAWNNNKRLPAFFSTDDVLDIFRAHKLGREINMDFIYMGSGDEYQKINALKETGAPVVVPLSFPKAYDVEDPLEAQLVSLKQMKHWEMAPYNPRYLEEQQIPFAFTSSQLEKPSLFWKHLRLAVNNGLSEQKALEALTTVPASLIHQESALGTLKPGNVANFIIANGNLFTDEKAFIVENWIQGKQYTIHEPIAEELIGTYSLQVGLELLQLQIQQKNNQLQYSLQTSDSTTFETTGSFDNNVFNLFYTTDDGRVRLTGWKSGENFKGKGVLANGEPVEWIANKLSNEVEEEKKDENELETKAKNNVPALNEVLHPFVGYGWTSQPAQQSVLFKNATVWTNEEEGILENTDVLIQHGKIQQIGSNLSAKAVITIDAEGKHLTAGIIDEHSHIAISGGVNEGTQSSSAEVRIGDVVNSEHIALYRVLAGGVTTSQLLHGSANPIGGQSAIIKSRWGLLPEEMKFEAAPGFIKFALGENVKQSNWGSQYSSRFPQTRMGVEQVYENYFTLAREYQQNRAQQPAKTRKNLELDALAEIMNNQRFISCHSYVQSEINMLMKVAEAFGFTVNTFTHILEGYKVADKMKEHGVGGSTFSDWWAYKYEVIDAIPYNAAVMAKEGMVTAINSDDAEMARRLNQEAAKAVKYGGLSEEEAWKTVTLNPAKLLRIDDRVGSIKVGKDADLVLWTDHPMSIYAVAEKTYVDGRKYFDLKEEEQKQIQIHNERERLIQQMLQAAKNGEPTQKPNPEPGNYYSCKHLEATGSHSSKHHH